MTDPLLQAQGLALRYRRDSPPVFADLDLWVRPREIVALLGESGCGKSSLLGLLAGLGAPSAGQVRFRGAYVRRTPADVSVVFQDPCLLPWLSVRGNAAFGLGFRNLGLPRAEREARASRALRDVGLADHAKRFPAQLSGGMAQRVALARALARQPALILLDEPFSALDALTRAAMQDLLAELVHLRASAALLVTHDIDEALRVADRLLLMGGQPAGIAGEWQLAERLGRAPRTAYSSQSLEIRDEVLRELGRHRRPPAESRPQPCPAEGALDLDPSILPESP
jgi:NitT/TauT family transport system ATP-binding protein